MYMTMDVEIISTEVIKPAFPTPDDLRHYKLCSLDQMIIPNAYIPIIFFYPNHHDSGATTNILVDQRIALLKKSLSETLTLFSPLAGTIIDGLSVDCDDRGASFTTAKVNCRMSEFLSQESPHLKLITRLFLPSGGNVNNISTDKSIYLINIQTTVFEKCGGIALGACISHKLVDGAAMSFFLKSWADISAAAAATATSTSKLQVLNNNNDNNNISPDFFTASSLFPASDLRVEEASMAMWGCVLKKGQFVTKRFVFDSSSIAALRNKAIIGNQLPTRVESVTALIWKCAMEYAACDDDIQEKSLSAGGGGTSTNKPPISLLTLAVNLRKRAVPNFSPLSLGNLTWNPSAKIFTADHKRNNIGFSDLVVEVNKCITKIDGEFVKKLLGEEGSSTLYQHLKENFIDEICCQEVDYFCFSSWCKLGLYKIDFGWGDPVWVSFRDTSGPFGMNFIILMDTKSGNGIEAWVTLNERKMAMLESNQKFRAFASHNPSPLRST